MEARELRIAFIVNNYPPKTGGVEFHTANLAQGLSKLGHRVWVLTISDTPGKRKDEEVEVITGKAHLPLADVISVPSLGSTRKIKKFLIKNQIDLVSVHTRFFPMSFVGLRAAHKAGIPVIHTEHGSGFVASQSPVISLGSRLVDMTMGRYVLRRANKVLGVSEEVTRFVHRLSGVSADVFYNAITPAQSDRPQLNRPHHLVFVGRMVEGKGWDTFIDAIAQLREQGFNVEGELVGGGPQLESAREYLHKLGLENAITITGRLTPEEVRVRLNGSTLVNPTVLSEGFQTTLVEAIAEGGRVVTFPVPGAQMLQELGTPVKICSEPTQAALVENIINLLKAPPPQADPSVISPLTWPSQTKVFARTCKEVIALHEKENN